MRQRGGGGGGGGSGAATGLPLYQGDATTSNTPSSGNNRLGSSSNRGATRQRRRPSDSGGAGSSLAISSTMSSSSWEITRSSNSTSDDEKDIEAGGGSGSQHKAIRRQRQIRPTPTRRRTTNQLGGGRTGGLYVDSGSDHLLLASSENDMDDDEGDYDELDLQIDHEQQQQQNLYYPAPLSNPQQQQQQSALSFHSLSNWQQQQQQQYQNGLYQYDHQQFYQKQMQQQQQMIIPTSPSSSSSLLLRRLHQSNLHQHHYNRGSNASLQDFHTVYRTPLHVPDNLYHDYIVSGSNSSLSLSSSLGGFHNNKHHQHHQRYLGHGGYNTVRRRQGRQAAAPIVTRTCFASYCGGFSAVASIFLIFVGILLDTQPLLIKGSLHQQVTSYSSNDSFGGSSRVVKKRYLVPRGTEGERLPSAHAAYQASLAYVVVVLLCWYVSNPTWINARIYRLRNKYQDIPDHTSSVSSNLPTFHAHDGSNTTGGPDGGIDTVNSSSSDAERGVISAAYHQGFLGGAAYLWRRFTNFGRQWLASRGWYYYAPASRRRHKYSTKRDV